MDDGTGAPSSPIAPVPARPIQGSCIIRSSGRSSSVGESTRLISAGSTVRIRPPAPLTLTGSRQLRTENYEGPRRAMSQGPRRAPGRRSGARSDATAWRSRPRACSWRLSGGPDSVALTHLLSALAASGELALAGAAHFNHQLRPDADRRRAVCGGRRRGARPAARRWTRRRRRRARGATGDPSKPPRTTRATSFSSRPASSSAPMSSRSATRATTRPRRSCCGCCAARAPEGSRPCIRATAAIIRPLLDCRRADLQAYLRDAGIESRAGRDQRRPRRPAQPGASRAAAAARASASTRRSSTSWRTKRRWRDSEWAWMTEVAAASRRGSGATRRSSLSARRRALAGQPDALARLLLRRAMARAAGGRDVGVRPRRAGPRIGPSGGGAGFDAPGQRLERIGPDVVLTIRPADTPGAGWLVRIPRRTFSGIRCLFQGRSPSPKPAWSCRPRRWRSAEPGGCIRGQPGNGRAQPGQLSGAALCQEPPAGGPISPPRAGRPEEAAGFLRRPEGGSGSARPGANRRDGNGPDRVGGRPRHRRGVSGDGPRASRASLET